VSTLSTGMDASRPEPASALLPNYDKMNAVETTISVIEAVYNNGPTVRCWLLKRSERRQVRSETTT
jgi:hypothetical protein